MPSTLTPEPRRRQRGRRFAGRALVAAALMAAAAGGLMATESAFTSEAGSESSFASDAAFPPRLDGTPPSIVGTPDEEQVLTADVGTWKHAASFEYQWLSCDTADAETCAEITGATDQTYTVPHYLGESTKLAGKKLRVNVTATNGTKERLEQSEPTADVRTKPLNTGAPTIKGHPQRGEELSVDSDGTWDADPAVSSYTYQWQQCTDASTCVDISGANGSTYTPVAADVGKTVRLKVTAENAVGSRTKATAQTAPVAAPLEGTASISGSPGSGNTLTANVTWTRAGSPVLDAATSYQWQSCDSAGNNCADIAGEVNQTYRTTMIANRPVRKVVVNGESTLNGANSKGTATATKDVAVVTTMVRGYTYSIRHKGSNQCMTALGTADNAAVSAGACGAASTWEFSDPGPTGYWSLFNAAAPTKLLEITGGTAATGNGAKTVLFHYVDTAQTNQQWSLQWQADGTFKLIVRHTGKCLDKPAGGTQFQQWDCNNDNNGQAQKLVLEEMPGPGADPNGWTFIKRADGLCLGAPTGGGAVRIQNCTGAHSQQWKAVPVGGGYSRVINRAVPGDGFDVDSGSTAVGAPIKSWAWAGGVNQQWQMFASGSGYSIKARHSGQCLDAVGAAESATKQYTCNGTAAQVFTVDPAPATP